MKLIINKEICVGCGSCAQAFPDVFKLGEDGKSEVVGEVSKKTEEELVEMASYCPVEAIEVFDEAGNKIFPKN
ncbi:MAG: ferredoxin [Patescibacteria group bacterium]